eukprot:CAMPEP_0180573826 /NCGR_PEP_ID=MMETSP1037_2-20121125/9981_1 /TAXON_ID=632150 /ORGANISM="Azadinium spinosum, Strain 3D9" /LENGTH=38 /DNA_ID= /DNA_START= /DNA_END= /DNA_ORIENTATION=
MSPSPRNGRNPQSATSSRAKEGTSEAATAPNETRPPDW